MAIMKTQLRKYLKKYKLTPSRFAVLAGVSRWSVGRYLKYEEAGLLHSTYTKISAFMLLNP